MSTLSRRKVLAAAGTAAAAAAAGSVFGFNILKRRRKNVVFIISDALRADRLGCYGYRGQTTIGMVNPSPFIDRCAAGGIVFERCIAPSSWTLESVAAIMSSRLPLVEGDVYNEGFVPDKSLTLAQTFLAAGYDTLAFTSNPWLWLTGAGGKRLTAGRGFATWNTVAADMVPNPLKARGIGNPMVYRRFVGAAEVAIKAVKGIKSRADNSRPFMLYLHVMDTHEPYNPPDRYKTICAAPESEGVPDFLLYQFIRTMATVAGREGLRGNEMKLFERARDLYDACVRYVDDSIGTLMDLFRQEGLYSDTLFVLSADHGEEFAEHNWIGHSTTLYEESVHVPLFFFGADVARGGRVSDPVSSLDIAPTLIRECGIRVPTGMYGRPLDLTGSEERDPLAAVSALVRPSEPGQLNEKIYAIADPRGPKLVRREYQGAKAGQAPVDELFDRRRDPWEKTNIAAGNAQAVAALQAQLKLLRDANKAAAQQGISLDEETRQKLKALGYLGGQAARRETTDYNLQSTEENRGQTGFPRRRGNP